MSDLEIFAVAFNNFRQQKLRSYLTLLGIVIGISAIVALVSLGQGLNRTVTEELERLGLNTIFIEPGSEESMATSAVARTIKERDLKIVEDIPGVREVVPFYEGGSLVKRNGEEVGVMVLGIKPEQFYVLEEIGYVSITDGRGIKSNDGYVMVVYSDFAEHAFDEEIHMREKVEMEGKEFRIVGISSQASMFTGGMLSNMVIVTADVAKELFGEESLTEAGVEAVSRDRVDEVAAEIEKALEKEHGTKDFYLITSENMLQGAGIILGLLQLIIVGIAAISLLVGGIGIMNTMFMTVIERTKEIGVMKAIGATNRKVLALFLVEAGYIGAIGGSIGIVAGLSISLLVSAAASYSGFALHAFMGPELIIGALGFSMLVGMISGFIPARRAAMLPPAEALRYE